MTAPARGAARTVISHLLSVALRVMHTDGIWASQSQARAPARLGQQRKAMAGIPPASRCPCAASAQDSENCAAGGVLGSCGCCKPVDTAQRTAVVNASSLVAAVALRGAVTATRAWRRDFRAHLSAVAREHHDGRMQGRGARHSAHAERIALWFFRLDQRPFIIPGRAARALLHQRHAQPACSLSGFY